MDDDGPKAFGVSGDDYAHWIIQHDTLGEEDRRAIRQRTAALPRHPDISVVLLATDPPPPQLDETIRSIQGQLYPHWELCLQAPARAFDMAGVMDPRLRVSRVVPGESRAAAANRVLPLAMGDFVIFVEAGDLLAEHALYEIAVALGEQPDLDVIYSDEDKVDAKGRRFDPQFKPLWSPELLCAYDAIGRLSAYRRSLLEDLGGFRPAFEGVHHWDLALRATAAIMPDRIAHVPAILYHVRESNVSGAAPFEDRRRVVESWLRAEGICEAGIEPAPLVPAALRVAYPLPEPWPSVTIIIPTRDRATLLKTVCDGILTATDWPRDLLDIIVVNNDSVESDTIDLLHRLEREPNVDVMHSSGPFNYAALNNLGVRRARGDIIVLMNNDIEIHQSSWLQEMVRLVSRREIGVAGPKLLYPDGRVQSAGSVIGPGGIVGHLLRFTARDDPGYLGQLGLTRSLSAITGACLALRREVFEEVGGFDEALAVTFNDTDLCLRLQDYGYRVVWTPDAVLTHWESATRGQAQKPEDAGRDAMELEFMRRHWGRLLNEDPSHNPNLLLHEGGGPKIPTPPRRRRSW
jgi:O-antigen biosynthesis protein